uniref:Secreted protein n=1 Tax=Heterorhabditis bacteriophora TaxID=37862 RepID=A0A1I7WA14_HETBA
MNSSKAFLADVWLLNTLLLEVVEMLGSGSWSERNLMSELDKAEFCSPVRSIFVVICETCGWRSALELHLGPVTERNAVGCRVESILRHMPQCDQGMGNFGCAKEAQSRFREGNFFDFRSARTAPICRAYLIASCGVDVVQLLNHQRLVLLQPLEWFFMGPLQQWPSVGCRQSPKDIFIFKTLVSVTKSSKPMLSCTFFNCFLTKCLVNIVSSFRYFTSYFELIIKLLEFVF